MDISSVNSDLIRGNVTTIILGCLKDADKYGYEILKEIEDRSHSQYALKQATLYNQLKRLEKQGLVRSYDGAPDDTGGGKRRYYALTPEGLNYLNKETGEYEYARTILDKLVSDSEFDFTKQIPFDASELRPYSKRGDDEEKTKIVYKDKIVEVEKSVEVEKRVYIDRFGNPLTEEEYERATTQALLDDEQARINEERLNEALAKLKEYEIADSETQDGIKVANENLQNALEDIERLKREQANFEEQLKLAEQERLEKEQALQVATASIREKEEALRLAEEQRMNSEAQLHQLEHERNCTEEELGASKAQLQSAEEKYAEYENQLRAGEEERNVIEQHLHASEQQVFALQEELRKLQEEREAEQNMKREAQTMPSTTVDELFSKLEAQSEYASGANARPTQIYADVEGDGQVYFEQAQSRQTTLQDLFRQMDEKAKEYEAERERQRQAEELERKRGEFEARNAEVASDAVAYDDREFVQSELDTMSTSDSYGATSATVTQNENGFEYERNHVNYRDFFDSITDDAKEEQKQEVKPQSQTQFPESDIKTRLYSKGFKIRPYDKGNTSEYYTFNFIQSNRINRDTFLIVLALFLAEMAVLWLSLATRITYVYFLPITVAGAFLCLIPTAIYFVNPTRRTRANFNFKLSILNRTMLFIELTVICILIGFFALGASVNDLDLILASMVIPAIILLNLPISSVIYYLLYRTRKYHIA